MRRPPPLRNNNGAVQVRVLQASVAGISRQVDSISRHPLKEIPMLKINNRKIEDQIKEILQRTSYASLEEYVIARVTSDHLAVKRGKKLP